MSIQYGRAVVALRDIDLHLDRGDVVAVLGANGAGKSTLIRSLCGTLALHGGSIVSGEVDLAGTDITGRPAYDIVRRGLAAVPEGRQIFTRMTVDDNLRAAGTAAATAEGRHTARQRVLDLFPILAERAHQAAGLLSGGEQQMLAIGRALMGSPQVLLLDEPSLGLAPQMIERVGEIVQEVNAQGTTVILVEQNASMALRVASQAVVLENGRIALSGAADELAGDKNIQHLYLGGHAEPVADPPGHALDHAGARRPRRERALSRWEA